MEKVLTVLIGLMVVAVSVWAGVQGADLTHRLIRLALPLPEVEIGSAEIRGVLNHLLVSGLIVFAIAAFLFRDFLFATAERTAKQVYAWGVAWGVGSLYLFLTSSEVFPHQILVGAFIVGVILFWAGYSLFGRDKTDPGRKSILGRLLAVVLATVRLLLKPWTWLAVLATIAPLIGAALYVANQEFRDSVAEFRVKQNVSVEGDWITVPINTETQLLQPIMIRFEPGRDDALFVLERSGRLYRMAYPDDGTKELLLDFSERVGEVNLENGALGFDFDPRWGKDDGNFVYIYFTNYEADKQVNYLARFDLGLADPKARLASQSNLMALGRPPTQYHNGGHVEFGPDGFLYLALGEMNIEDSWQRVDRALSSGIVRIDVQNQGGDVSSPIARQPRDGKTQGYSIPNDNPFVTRPETLGEFYAIGLRNPFRFHIDPQTGLLWTGDVGTSVWEEVNAVEKGKNYQYPYDEGGKPTEFDKPNEVVGDEAGPLYSYKHNAYDRSVIGGVVYRGKRWPQLNGKYIFGDNYSGKFWAMEAIKAPVSKVVVLGQANKFAQRGFTSVIQASDDRILITIMGSSSAPNGAIVELVHKSAGAQSAIGGGKTVAGAEEVLTDAMINESYVTNCARCHGETGAGDGPDSEILETQLGAAPTDFRTAQFKSKPKEQVRKAIADGGTAVGLSEAMPPWTGILEEPEIDALVEYIRELPAGDTR